jgi:hypothetical protein
MAAGPHRRPPKDAGTSTPRKSDNAARRRALAPQNTAPAWWTHADDVAFREEADAEVAEEKRLDQHSVVSTAAGAATTLRERVTQAPAVKAPFSSGFDSVRSAIAGDGPGHSLLGFVFGVILYATFINFLRNGKAGVYDWLAAKFINVTPAQKTGPTPLASLVDLSGLNPSQSSNDPPPSDVGEASAAAAPVGPAPSIAGSPKSSIRSALA